MRIDEFIDIITKRFDIVMLVSDHGLGLFSRGFNFSRILNLLDSESISSGLKSTLISMLTTNIVVGLVSYVLSSYLNTYLWFYRVRTLVRFSSKSSRRPLNDCLMYFDEVGPSDAMIFYFKNRKHRDLLAKCLEVYLRKYFLSVEPMDVEGIPALLVVPREDLYLNLDPIHKLNRSNIVWFPLARHTLYGIFA